MTKSSDGPIILAIDVGSTLTKLAVIAPVDGRARLIADLAAPTTYRRPYQDVAVALRSLLRRLERDTGWRLVDERGALRKSENMSVVVSASAPPPLTIAVIATAPDRAAAVAERARRLGYGRVLATLSLEGHQGGRDRADAVSQQLAALDKLDPRVIVVEAGTKKQIVRVAALLRAVDEPSRGPRSRLVLFAGPDAVAVDLSDRLPSGTEFRHVGQSGWLQAGFDGLAAHQSLARAYLRAPHGGLPGLDTVLGPGHHESTITSDEGAERVIAFLARARNASVGLLDVGGQSTCALTCRPGPLKTGQSATTGAGSLTRTWVHDADLGTGSGLEGVLQRVSVERIRRWLPFDVDEDAMRDYLGGGQLHDKHVPQDVSQLLIEQAVARECANVVRAGGSPVHLDLLIATGGIARQPRLGHVALLLLDTFQPVGPTRLLVDAASLLPRLGALAGINSPAALSVLQHDTLVDVGPVLSVTGQGREGETVARVHVQELDRGAPSRAYDIRFGTITVAPLAPGQRAEVRVSAERKFGIVLPSPAAPAASAPSGRREGSVELSGGVLGLIIDARGRPLAIPDDVTRRQARIMDWLQATDAVPSDVFSRLG